MSNHESGRLHLHPKHKRKELLGRAATLHKAGRLAEAMELYRKVLKDHPTDMDAIYGTAIVLWQSNEIDGAIQLMRGIVARAPKFAEAHYNLACMLQSRRDPVSAMMEYHIALQLQPEFADAWEGLGTTLRYLGSHGDALLAYTKAIALAQAGSMASAEARFNICYPLLSMGRWKEGWAAYEERFNTQMFRGVYVQRHMQPLWRDQDLTGKRLLVHAEQGYGDSLMCMRYIPRLLAKFERIHVIIEVPVALYRLFKLQPWAKDCTLRMQKEDVGVCDFQVPMMSLPHRFGTEVETVPLDGIPLSLDQWPADRSRPELPGFDPNDGLLRVGFAFAGNPGHKNDANRSTDIRDWKPLFQVPGVRWYSLQMDWEITGVECYDVRKLVRDFADSAALVDQLDMVIAVDTAIIHLAGCLGKPTIMLTPAVPDFRWLLDRLDTPWYPSVHLYRQENAGDWPGVIEKVRRALVGITTTPAEDGPNGPTAIPAADVGALPGAASEGARTDGTDGAAQADTTDAVSSPEAGDDVL